MAIMCQGQLQFESIELAYLIDFRNYFAPELIALARLAEDGLVRLDKEEIQMTDQGWFFVRAVAMVFDHYLQTDLDRARFSGII